MPIISSVQKFVRNQFRGSAYGVGERAMERGGESVIISSMIQIFQTMALMGGFLDDEDEETKENVMRDSFRWFLPFYINLGIEAFIGGRPGSIVRAYSQSAYRVGKWIGDATGINEED